jgi:hypothetical protein
MDRVLRGGFPVMAGNDDTVQVAFYAPWPNFGVKLSQQWGQIRTDTSHLAPVVRGIGLDASGDFTTLDGVEKAVVQAWEVGEQDFHNRFRTHYNKTDDLFEIQSNIPPGTSAIPNWYTTWSVGPDGQVAAQTTSTTASNVGTGAGVFKQKTGTDLQFKTLVDGGVLTITENANDLTFSSTAEANTASSLGGTSLIGTKSGVVLPFKGITAGSNMSLADDGTQLTLSSTAQVVEFYGIVTAHTDDSFVNASTHVLKFNVDNFYATAGTTSARETILNFRGETFDSSAYVEVAGDTMTGALLHPDGNAGAPSVSFSGETTSGLTRLTTNDIALVSGGTSVLRALSDRVYLPTRTQIKSSGLVGTPDLCFFANSTTGLFQKVADDDSIAFATGGVEAGYFDTNQDLYVTNEIRAGKGTGTAPSFSFHEQTDMGLSWASASALDINTGGAVRLKVEDGQLTPTVPTRPNFDGTAAACAYGWNAEAGLGLFRKTSKQLGFATPNAGGTGTLAAYFDSSQDFHTVSNHFLSDGAEGAPSLAFTSWPTVGIYATSASNLRFSQSGVYTFSVQSSGCYPTVPMRFNFNAVVSGGTVSEPCYSFLPDTNTGVYQNDGVTGDDSIAFSTGGTRAGYFDSNNDLYVTNDIIAGGDVETTDEAYGATWDGSDNVPTKNAVYDKIETLSSIVDASPGFYGVTFKDRTIRWLLTTTTSTCKAEATVSRYSASMRTRRSNSLLLWVQGRTQTASLSSMTLVPWPGRLAVMSLLMPSS